jgi:hypothetical protein
MITLAPDDNISSQMITLAPDYNIASQMINNISSKMITLSPDELSYHLGRNVIIWDEMLSSGANIIIWY